MTTSDKNTTNMAKERVQDGYEARLIHALALERKGINIFPPDPSPVTHLSTALVERFSELEGQEVGIAGRIDSERAHGKISFYDVTDADGKIQVVVSEKNLGAEEYGIVSENIDPGDFIFAKGKLGKTRSGEVSVIAEQVRMLAKSLRPLPDSVSMETAQRQRYLDLLLNPETRRRFVARSMIVQGMRERFLKLGCMEVETAVLSNQYGGAEARPFVTHHNAIGEEVYMRISNELELKRLTAAFQGGVFEFSRDFRNEGMDATHNPEFTQVELYKPYTDYRWMMGMSENLMAKICRDLHGSMQISYGDLKIDLTPPWRRLTIYDGLRESLRIEPKTIGMDELQKLAKAHNIEGHTKGEILLKLFDAVVGPTLVQPTFVMDYPSETSALTKKHRDDPEVTERFECVVGGMEVMNCYTELNDPRDQRARFEAEKEKRARGDKEAMQFDEDFLLFQEYGMPQQGGIGISIDRWTMLLTNTQRIRDVILFPLLKPEK